ncbi:hypothetical protein L208DRAFT_1505029 [Tricholoma matsutake]|nr:hypothetical protein L208DRAFT_1505029 [Tricholoma matsutake 945]
MSAPSPAMAIESTNFHVSSPSLEWRRIYMTVSSPSMTMMDVLSNFWLCQVGEFLLINRAVGALAPNDGWQGSLMVMKCSIQASYVGLHSAWDRAMVYHAVERFMFESNFALPFIEVKMGYPTKIGF